MTTVAEDGETQVPTPPPAPPVPPAPAPGPVSSGSEARRVSSLTITEEQVGQMKELARVVVREPFTKRPWMELAFFLVSGGLAGVGLALVGATMLVGVVLAITFFGLAVLALSLRSARGIGRWQRDLVRNFLGETIPEPEPFTHRSGFFGWLQGALRDRVAWRAVGYLLLKVPWTVLGTYVAFSLWWDAISCLLQPLWGRGGGPSVWGLAQNIFLPGAFNQTPVSFWHGVAIFIVGIG
ncbi:MAG TPA: sensor domain-containing protein, partial [Acidimicrobiales bacterium]|nr:sensor domain-containing protein [Acidimicrobiales bacterium]